MPSRMPVPHPSKPACQARSMGPGSAGAGGDEVWWGATAMTCVVVGGRCEGKGVEVRVRW